MVKPGKFPSGKTEIPFEFPLHVKGNKVLYETYHGVFVNIQVSVPEAPWRDAFHVLLLEAGSLFIPPKGALGAQELSTGVSHALLCTVLSVDCSPLLCSPGFVCDITKGRTCAVTV